MEARQRLSAIVRGAVQGVGFRWSVQHRATSLGLYGYAANRPDGTVEVVAEGAPSALDELDAYLRSGPRLAEVATVDVQRGQATGEFRGFATK